MPKTKVLPLRIRPMGRHPDVTYRVYRGRELLGTYFLGGASRKWRVLMPDQLGRPVILLPDLYADAPAALKTIVQNHEPEVE